jgi:UDP-N-acetylglucosamine--N-acetylmuramyl-(pentapeptide) pyrophosphoryl-undecaprenol N-acetylglucosamine transferase
MRILLAAGGTGGHVFPALAVAHALRRLEPECRITFAGRPEGFERDAFEGLADRYLAVPCRPLPRRAGWKTLAAGAAATAAASRCGTEILRRRPAVAVGFGGYVSGPALLAARMLGVPTAIHEQNAIFGKVNRWLSRSADRIFVSYRESVDEKPGGKVEWAGMPVRGEVVGREANHGGFGLEPERITLFFLGGSQGSRNLCRAAVDTIGILAGRGMPVQAIVQTGKAGSEEVRGRNFPVPVAVVDFIEDMGAAYACSDFVIARAGASSVAEIAANGLPAVFVPYPYATDDHQRKNVEPLAAAGAAMVLADEDLCGDALAKTLIPFLADTGARTRMGEAIRGFHRAGAADRIARGVLELGRKCETGICTCEKELHRG